LIVLKLLRLQSRTRNGIFRNTLYACPSLRAQRSDRSTNDKLRKASLMEKFLVTGGAGFIGSNICKKLVSQDCFVRVVDNLLTGKKSNLAGIIDKIDFIEADMGDERIARSAMKDIDVVLHQGALPSVPRSVDDPAATHKHCVDATFTLLLAARDARLKRFVYASSSSAYGDAPTLPKVETMPPQPLSPYAAAKLAGEYYCSVFCSVFGLETISLRYFNVFGPHQDPTSQYAAAIPAFVMAILKDKPPTILIIGGSSHIMDLKVVSAPVGSPEYAMMNAAAAQMAHYYNLPCVVGGA